ncbi:hypothetical protein [Candidatus Poriferisodalis sp.]|uniref:hypothetical protein n=1 Tax=Candidatus Poriferisodalis sp. TaxID=3101277 RepID=UPI003B518F16
MTTRAIRPNEWRRQRNQALVQEVFKIIDELDWITYTASIDKAKMRHPMTQRTTMPLQLQALVEHFAVEGDDAMQLLDTGVGATLLQTLGRRRTHRVRRWTNHIVVF